MEDDALPVRRITVNQVVAWNLAFWRHEAGLTQTQLGILIGWTNTAVSEAERSWDGKRTREFDAHTLIALALALDIPLNALFLPPLDDGRDAAYLTGLPGQIGDIDMAGLLAAVLYGDPDDDSGIMASYRRRLLGQVGQYHGDDWRDEVAQWLVYTEGPAKVTELMLRMQGDRARLQADADDLGAWADAFGKAMREEGQ